MRPGDLGKLMGMQVFENPHLTEPGEPYEARRSWKERLFSRPWRPLKATRTVVPQLPSKQFVVTGNKMFGHPETIREMERQLKESLKP